MADEQLQPPVSGEPSTTQQPSEVENTRQSSAETQHSSSSPKCASCSKPESDPENPLKPCIKCHSARYCSRECQKADFKRHKKTCASAAQEYAKNANLKIASGSRTTKEGHRGGLQKWQFDT